MTENDNNTPSVDDIISSAQNNPELVRNMAAALAEVAPEQAAAAAARAAPERAATAAAEVAPEQAAAAAARAAPERAATAAAEVAPEQAAAALAAASPDKAKDIAAGAAHTLTSKAKSDLAGVLAQTIPHDTLEAKELANKAVAPLPQVHKKSIATEAVEALSPDNKKEVVNKALNTLPPEAARSIDNAVIQETLYKNNLTWLNLILVFATLFVLLSFVILVTVAVFVFQEKEIATAITQELLTISITVAAALAGYAVGAVGRRSR